MVKTKSKKVKEVKEVTKGRIYINSSFNNTIVTVTDEGGNVISWASSGSRGFKGTKKSTPYAASIVAKEAVSQAVRKGLKEAMVLVSGVGSGRESAVRALGGQGVRITTFKDITPVAHNGPRPKKPRRV